MGIESSLKAKVAVITNLKDNKKVESSITKEEEKPIETLRKDRNIMIFPADKGKCTVILDKEEYKH